MLLSELQFASFLVYNSRDKTSEIGRRHRNAVSSIKNGDSRFYERARIRFGELPTDHLIRSFLGDKPAFVPCPRSAPLPKSGALWPPLLVAQILAALTNGTIHPFVERVTPVLKSAIQTNPADRTTAIQHLESMRNVGSTIPSENIIVVDDVVTSGATLLATASHLRALNPQAIIKGFALIRVVQHEPVPMDMIDPVTGKITFIGPYTKREP